MKKTNNRIITLILALIISVSPFLSRGVNAADSFELVFALNEDDAYSIIGYMGTAPKELVLPNEHDGKPVTVVEETAFAECHTIRTLNIGAVEYICDGAFWDTTLEKIELPNVTFIGDDVFGDCANLTDVSMPALEVLGARSFNFCTSLTEITIPAKTDKIDVNPFLGCENLTDIRVEEGNALYTGRDGMLLGNEGTAIYSYPSAKGDVVLPDYITTGLAPLALAYNCNIRSVTGKNVETIEYSCFFQCALYEGEYIIDGLRSVDFPNATYIGDAAFCMCSFLEEVDFPKVKTVSYCAFMWSQYLETVNLPSVEFIDLNAFWDCRALKNLFLSDCLNEIFPGAFGACRELDNIYIPDTNPYYSTDGVFIFNKDKTVLVMGQGASGNVVLPDSVKEIQMHCFSYAVLKTLDTNNVERIPEGGLDCLKCKKVILPNVKSIDKYGLQDCSAINIIAPEVREIGEGAFGGCFMLKKIALPKAEVISECAFLGCQVLAEVTLGNVKQIGCAAFGGCHKRLSVYLCCDAPEVIPDAEGKTGLFTGSGGEQKIYYPVNAKGYDTEYWQQYNFIEFNFAKGDVNQDGTVNTEDAAVVLRVSADMTTIDACRSLAADVNFDGKVNTADAVLILKYAAGMITTF